MVLRLWYKAPYYVIRIGLLGKGKNYDLEKSFRFIQKVTQKAVRAGRVTIDVQGLENIPK